MLSEKLAKALDKSQGAEGLQEAPGASVGRRGLSGSSLEPAADDPQSRLEAALDALVRHARHATGADGAALALDGEGGLVCRASCGLAPDLGIRLDPRRGLCGRCFSSREVTVWSALEDTSSEISSVLAVPILGDESAEGVIAVFAHHAGVFSGAHLAALCRLGNRITRQLAFLRPDSDAPAPAMYAAPMAGLDPAMPAIAPSDGTGDMPLPGIPIGQESGSSPSEVVGAYGASCSAMPPMPPGAPGPETQLGSAVLALKSEAAMPEPTAEDTSVFNIPFEFEMATLAQPAYLAPLIAVLLTLLIALGGLAALSWRADQVQPQAYSPAAGVAMYR
jgi:hypothetical protein